MGLGYNNYKDCKSAPPYYIASPINILLSPFSSCANIKWLISVRCCNKYFFIVFKYFVNSSTVLKYSLLDKLSGSPVSPIVHSQKAQKVGQNSRFSNEDLEIKPADRHSQNDIMTKTNAFLETLKSTVASAGICRMAGTTPPILHNHQFERMHKNYP